MRKLGRLWCREAQLRNQVVWNPSGSAQNSVLAGTPCPSSAQRLDETSACLSATSREAEWGCRRGERGRRAVYRRWGKAPSSRRG